MATNHTEHYQLSQWEATDRVLREDFNADNQKIDAAIAGRVVVGTYKGSGGSQVIETGFRPSGVIVAPRMLDYYSSYTSGTCNIYLDDPEAKLVTMEDNGFRLASQSSGNYPSVNFSTGKYWYIAFR